MHSPADARRVRPPSIPSRSRSVAKADPSSPSPRCKVLRDIECGQCASWMSGGIRSVDGAVQDMASEEQKAVDDKAQEENLSEALGALEVQTEGETDAFQCGRCKQVRVALSPA